MIKMYISAVKVVLADEQIYISEDKYQLNCLTRACSMVNDCVKTRLPLHKALLELLLCDLEMLLDKQSYLTIIYQGIFTAAYYGLLRIREITFGNHPIRAIDVHIGTNKQKILFILRTPKTNGRGKKPQFIKIAGSKGANFHKNMTWCPFTILQQYVMARLSNRDKDKPFFVFTDRSGIRPVQITIILRKCLKRLGLSPMLYSFHGFCRGHANDLHQIMK